MEHQKNIQTRTKKRLWMYVLFGVFLGFLIIMLLGTLTAREIDYIETVSPSAAPTNQ